MMSGVPLETCWAFNKLWNNKFYYKSASCWYIQWGKFSTRPVKILLLYELVKRSFNLHFPPCPPVLCFPSIKTIIKHVLFIIAQNTGCCSIMLETLEARCTTDGHTPIRPHQNKQLSKVMAGHIHVQLLMSVHTQQTSTVLKKRMTLVCVCAEWVLNSVWSDWWKPLRHTSDENPDVTTMPLGVKAFNTAALLCP